MFARRFILLFICVFGVGQLFAQREGGMVQSRILILLDESSSMIQPWASGKEKYRAAREIILKLMDSVYAVNREVEFSLRVFGHQHTVPENNCYDTKNEVPFSRDNRSQMSARLEDIHPLGVTPIAWALTEAADKDIVDENHNAYSIILITDGGESCGGDICDVMKKLLKYKVYFKPYIVSLENDPSLRVTYACMGDFLQVTHEKDIPKAVSTIVSAFRPVLKINDAEYKEIQNIAAKAPSVLKVKIPELKTDTVVPKKWTAEHTAVSAVPYLTGSRSIGVNPPAPQRLAMKEAGQKLPDVKVDEPVVHEKGKIQEVAAARTRLIGIPIPLPAAAVQINRDLPAPKLIIDTPVAERKTDALSKLRLARLRQFNVIFVIEDHTYSLRQVPPLPPVKAEIVPVETVSPKAPVSQPVSPKANKHEFKIETVPDRETTVSVYFTNGKGKFYTTTPQVMLLDAASKKPVKKFFRTVDPAGNPDPQDGIPAGEYDLTLPLRPDYYISGIKVEANKNNKVIVTVKNTTLGFVYDKAPNRPVKEFYAIVTERNKAQGRVQEQKCTEPMMYEPGNYHIEINTFPQDVRNVDLDFDGETVITIPQPGFAKFKGDEKIGSVTLFRQYGDKYLGFYTLNLKDPKSQHLQIQPGAYQVHYQSATGPKLGSATEQVQVFHIRANEETEIILK